MLVGGREIRIKQQVLGKWRREKGGSRPPLLIMVSVHVCSQTSRGLLIIVKHFFLIWNQVFPDVEYIFGLLFCLLIFGLFVFFLLKKWKLLNVITFSY